ncbi:MAG: hypothetical protein WCA56_09000 [Xanthobacteraceae bacterium]
MNQIRRIEPIVVLAAALALAATPAAAQQTGFNPGTVVGNVYESPACANACGFGYSPPRYAAIAAPAHHHHRSKLAAARSDGGGTTR